jgi:DEAD/DEAH box helicase domain-containing protein
MPISARPSGSFADQPAPIEEILNRLRRDIHFMENVVAWEKLPARSAQMRPFPPLLDSRLVDALRARGIVGLYTHQAEAIEASFDGQNVITVTGTASGKTLCFSLPTLQACLQDPNARALFLFPTKALAQDQAAALNALGTGVPVRIYDGDTPQSQRAAIRTTPGIILSNPDMLHQGILPSHTRWARFFENLKIVVIDELHAYRGIFGSHVANVIRRLRRICRFYGSDPLFLCASATIANPQDLAERLTEAHFTVVSSDGSPRGEKHVILYNPPFMDSDHVVRRPYTLETREIATRFIESDIQTLVFARSRLTTELLLTYLREGHPNPESIRGYRGGYLPSERRAIETGLRGGEVRGVVATNALELGVDIGQLNAVVIAGYPGTIASTWQQAGRAGRRTGVSTAVIVMSAAPMDQFLALHPRYLFENPVEAARVNPDNLVILLNHIRCAAYELPFNRGDQFGRFGNIDMLLEFLVEDEQVLAPSATGYRWIAPDPPAHGVNLRTGSGNPILVQDSNAGAPLVVGQVDRETAPLIVYPGAIYMHEGRQYAIEALDWEMGVADARPVNVDFYTEAVGITTLRVLKEADSAVIGDVVAAHGLVDVTSVAAGYRIIKRFTHEVLGMGEIKLPEQRFETTGYWCSLTPDLTSALEDAGVLVAPNDYGPNWQAMRHAARARDGYKCVRCGEPELPEREHHVHHVVPFYTFGYIRGQNTAYLAANQIDNLQTLCARCHRIVETSQRSSAALIGVGNVLRNAATLYLMCEPGDLGMVVDNRNEFTGAPTISLYDNLPAGLGYSDRLFEIHGPLMEAAEALIRDCPCAEGCPACIGPITQPGENAKAFALQLITAMQAGPPDPPGLG